MKKVLFGIAVCAAVFAGCQEEATESLPKDYSKFTATFEDGGSRVILDSEDYASWKANDKVSVFNESGTHYTYTADKDGRETTLSGPADAAFTNDIFALFPYKESKTETDKAGNVYKYGNWYENRTLVSELATEQAYGDAMNHAIMVAKIPATEDKFVFKNSCALVKININTSAGFAGKVKINSINVKSESQYLSGVVTIGSDYTANISEGVSNSVVLTGCSAADCLTTEYKSFLLVIPAGTYPAGDLKVSIDTDSDDETINLDYSATLTKDYTVNRSQYIELKTTLDNNVFEGGDFIDMAIMADNNNLSIQGFTNQYQVLTEYPIQSGDLTIDGGGKVYNFKRTKDDIYIINTFTTLNSGIKNVTAPTITVKDITITGILRSTHLGIWVHSNYTGPTYTAAENFNTVFENVKVIDNKIVLWTETEGSAVATFGEATFNNCVIKGAEWEDPNTSAPIYDLSVRNSSHAYLIGGEFGRCQGKEHSKMTISEAAVVEYLCYIGIDNGGGVLTVEKGTVNHLLIKPSVQNSGSRYPVVKILAGAIIPKLEFVGVGNWKGIQIDPAANVTEIYVDGAKFEGTLAEFIAAKSITTPTATE